jgi:hypothetical protein
MEDTVMIMTSLRSYITLAYLFMASLEKTCITMRR